MRSSKYVICSFGFFDSVAGVKAFAMRRARMPHKRPSCSGTGKDKDINKITLIKTS